MTSLRIQWPNILEIRLSNDDLPAGFDAPIGNSEQKVFPMMSDE